MSFVKQQPKRVYAPVTQMINEKESNITSNWIHVYITNNITKL